MSGFGTTPARLGLSPQGRELYDGSPRLFSLGGSLLLGEHKALADASLWLGEQLKMESGWRLGTLIADGI